MILGLEPEDWFASVLVWAVVIFVQGPLAALGLALLVALLIRVAKRGQPPGALLHAAWALGAPLPGWLPAPSERGQRYSAWN